MTETPRTIAGVIEAQAERLGDKPYLLFEDRVVSFAELNRQREPGRQRPREAGSRATGVGVSIMMPNAPEWLFVYFATQKLGAYAVPVNTALKGEGLRHVLDHSDSSVLVCHPEYVEAILDVRGSLPKLKHIVIDTTEAAPATRRLPAGSRFRRSWTRPTENPGVEIEAGALSGLMYTSGTTGAPKGVVQRYRPRPPSSVRGPDAIYEADEVLYTCLPLFHANALFLSAQRALVLGLTLALSRRFSASRFWDEIRRYNATTFNALGAMIPILMKQPERENDRDNKVRIVLSAACPASVWEAFEQRFGVRLVEAYGAVDGAGFGDQQPRDVTEGFDREANDPDPHRRRRRQRCPRRRAGRVAVQDRRPQPPRVEYYKNDEATERQDPRRLALHRRPRLRRRRRQHLLRRPQDRLDAPPRREHLVVGSRARNQRPPRRAGVRRVRRSVRTRRGRRDGGRRPARRAVAQPRGIDRPLRDAHGEVHGAALHRVPGRTAQDRHPPRAEEPTETAGRDREHLGPRACNAPELSLTGGHF